MDSTRLLDCLEADFRRLRRVVAQTDLATAVPSCPGWTVADLVRHVAMVYLHKVECLRLGAQPQPWPPDGLDDEEPLATLDRAYPALRAELAARAPDSATYTWFAPDQSVGFWIRRMAHETAIHRVDAELSASTPITAVPADQAHDGIDELLVAMVEYGARTWPEDYAETLADAHARPIRLETPELAWQVRPTRAAIEVGAAGDEPAVAFVRGEPQALLLWLWHRADDAAVTAGGDPSELARLRRILDASTV